MIKQDIQKLDPGHLMEMFVVDATALGGDLMYFYPGTSELRSPITWQGQVYTAWPVVAEGFDKSTRGTLPTPTLRMANIAAVLTQLNIEFDDMIGAKVIRKRTFSRYLDGQPEADPNAHLPDDVFYVERKVGQNRVACEYELASVMDVEGLMLPKRQVLANLCSWRYRSAECSYAGGPVAKADDSFTAVSGEDNCSKRLSGCKLRFGERGPLPYGGFPGVNRY
jgi:lambda family phage minor tail protein L